MRTTNNGGDFQIPSAGMKLAICFKIIDLGTHAHKVYGTKKRLVLVSWELPMDLMDDGRPFAVSKRYTASHNEKSTLRIDLESWYGKSFNTRDLDLAGGFDLSKILGRPALLNIVHSEDGRYANIKAITPMPVGMTAPHGVNPLFTFDLEPFDPEKFAKLSQKLQDFIGESDEWKARSGEIQQVKDASTFDDGIPF